MKYNIDTDEIARSIGYENFKHLLEVEYLTNRKGYKKIGRWIGISETTVANRVRDAGFPPHPPGGKNHVGRHKSKYHDKIMIMLNRDTKNLTLPQIAKQMNLKYNTLKYLVFEAGYKIPHKELHR